MNFETTGPALIGAFLVCLSTTATLAEPIPQDPDRFLTFFNSVSPAHEETLETANAYYQAVDPDDIKTTLNDWQMANGFDAGIVIDATYVNDADLGFGRHMVMKVPDSGRIAYYVENFSDNTPLGDPVDGPAEEKIANAHNGTNIIATVAMEYGPPPGDPAGQSYTSFYVFGPDGSRLTAADLDGRGAKFVPGACNICHGGAPRPLLADGTYPDSGDTGAGFLPWDLDSFKYSAELFDGEALYTRAAQESAFRALNAVVLSTNPTAVVEELVNGWYGGPGQPNLVFDGSFVPGAWSAHTSTYLDVFAPNCRACHIMRNPAADFSTYQKLSDLTDRAQALVFDRGVMPLARRTYDKFWPDFSSTDPDFTDLLGTVPVTRRPGAGAPIAFAGVDQPALVGASKQLDGSKSNYATSFNWTMLSSPAGSTASLDDPALVNPAFTPDLPGTYEFEMSAVNAMGNATSSVSLVATSGVLTDIFTPTGIDFATKILPIIDAQCISCHTSPANMGIAPPFDEPLVTSREETIYRNLSLRANAFAPDQSLMLLKSSGQVVHGGGTVLTAGSIDYNLVRDWIRQGVVREVDADDDGLDDRLESGVGTDNMLADTDGDDYFDSVEVVYGSAPDLASSIPAGLLRLSINRSGWGGVSYSDNPSVNADGRLIAFRSDAWNLVLGVNTNAPNIFIKDVLSGKIFEADVDCNCVGSGAANSPAISADGRFVAFQSFSVRLIFSDTNNVADIFVTDLESGETTRVSTDSFGNESNGHSGGFPPPAISADGRFVAFASDATNLVANDTNFTRDVFLKDRDSGVTTRISTDSSGAEAQDFESGRPTMSATGQYVAFVSEAANLVAGDTNFVRDVFLKNTVSGATTRVSTDSAGAQANGASNGPVISANGQFLVFSSTATNLVAGADNGQTEVYLKNLSSGLTTLVSVNDAGDQANGVSFEPSISDDGRYVTFTSFASDLGPVDGNGQGDVYIRDLVDNITLRVSMTATGPEPNNGSGGSVISGDGSTVTFQSLASNLADDDTNFGNDIFQTTNPFLLIVPTDTDGDGIFDASDNCTLIANPDQRDTNGDGFGNLCDPDLDNNGVTNFVDYSLLTVAFLATPSSPNWNPDADFNGDDVVNFVDISLFPPFFLMPPGPAGSL